ncbi:hypothetical protein [Massilia sp. X63]|uniref:hypothetical protein n=1 Tax=Massilia sp. X63 TaxID=3237285 RepID=UPI0034DD3F13
MPILRQLVLAFAICFSCLAHAAPPASVAAPLTIGESWTLDSAVLGETRRINVYLPAGIPPGTPLPLMVMPDGGMLEDFLHVAGLLPKTLYIAGSADAHGALEAAGIGAAFGKLRGVNFHYEAWPTETHATIYHPAALKAFRAVLKPPAPVR